MALKRPIYKGFRTCGWRIEIFLYGKEYGKSSQTENVHQTYFFLSTDGGAALLAASSFVIIRLMITKRHFFAPICMQACVQKMTRKPLMR